MTRTICLQELAQDGRGVTGAAQRAGEFRCCLAERSRALCALQKLAQDGRSRALCGLLEIAVCAMLFVFLAGCEKNAGAASSGSDIGPHPTTVQPDMDANHFKVDRPEQFEIVTAGEHAAAPELNVTGVINPDVSRQVPVVSLASGRIVEIDAKLGDSVKKGQLLFKVRSPDIAQVFSDYRKAVVNEQLSKIQLDRAQALYENGAIPKSSLESAANAEDNSKVDVDTTTEHLRVLGADAKNPTGIVPVYAPVSGVITDQQITNAAGVQGLSSPNPFTISDVSHVWIMCDVYENDLAQVHLGEYADIRLNAFPGRVLKGLISNIGEIMDPNLHTAKVRLQVENPGFMRLGMFITATFHGRKTELHATVPAAAILHLHDRDWIYLPAGGGAFRRAEVVGGNMLPGNLQEVLSGLEPGTKVVANALVLQNTVEQ